MARYATTEKTHECQQCYVTFAEREAIRKEMRDHTFLGCPSCEASVAWVGPMDGMITGVHIAPDIDGGI